MCELSGVRGMLRRPTIAVPSSQYAVASTQYAIGGKPSANFDYSGPLTEAVILGCVAVRFPKTTLKWNAAKMQFDNEKAANQFVRRKYRKGFQVAGL